MKDASEKGTEKRTISRKFERTAREFDRARHQPVGLNSRPLDAVGISKQLAKRASNELSGLKEVLGTPLRVNESVYSQTTRSEYRQGRGNKAIPTRHACVISGTKGDGVLSFLCVENGNGGMVSMMTTKINNNKGGDDVDDVDTSSSSPKSMPQILTRPNKSRAPRRRALVKSIGGLFRRSLLENDTSAVTTARIDVFPKRRRRRRRMR